MFRVVNLLVVVLVVFCLLAADAQAFGGRVVVRNGIGARNVVAVNAGGANVVVNRGGVFRRQQVIVNGGFAPSAVVVPSGFQSFNSFQSFGVGGSCVGCGVGARVLVVP